MDSGIDAVTGRVLVVDDEKPLARMIATYLTRAGYDVATAHTGPDAVEAARSRSFDVVVLDLGLPGLDGIEVCRRIRGFSECYVLMLTARGDEDDKLAGLAAGADDYITKPFSPRELLARIRAVLRRRGEGGLHGGADAAAAENLLMRFGSLEIDRNSRTVTVGGTPAELTSYQFDLLVAMAERAGRVLTRDQIMEAVRGRELEAFDRSIDVHMGRIRAAIEADAKNPKRILTVRGVGYVFARQQD